MPDETLGLKSPILELANVIRRKFTPPEYIPGCKVTDITDIDEYTTDNGWLRAFCGHHNNQRVRYLGFPAGVQVDDYVDVIHYPDRKAFECQRIGGTAATGLDAVKVSRLWENDGGTITMWADADGGVSIGSDVTPHGGVGIARFGIEAANASVAGPHIQITTAADDYPLFQHRSWQHDRMDLSFDAFYDGSDWISSDAGSNFQIRKSSDLLRLRYDGGVAQGGTVTWEEGLVLHIGGQVTLGTNTNNSDQTVGLTIDQGANNDEAFALKQSNVAHGMTSEAETDTYFNLGVVHSTLGGAALKGFGEQDTAVVVTANVVTADTTKDSSSQGPVLLVGALKSGTTITSLGSNSNLAVFRNNTATRLIVDVEGTLHQTPSSDLDVDMLTVQVTGTPTLSWDESEDAFSMDKGLRLTSGELGIGTTDVPHGAVGAAMLAMEGPDSSTAGPHMQFTTVSDNWPVFTILPWAHDTISLNFDCYTDAVGYKSSSAGSNFQIIKFGDKLRFRYDSGIATGSAISFNEGLTLDDSGRVGVGLTSPLSAGLQVQKALSTVYANATPNIANCLLALVNLQAAESDDDHATILFNVYGGSYNRVGSITFGADSASSRIGYLAFCTDDGGSRTEKLRIEGGGNVGIGTSAPGSLTEWNMATLDLEFVDAGTASATEAGWVDVQIGGTTMYLRAFASK
jgi:hypothetical protein